LDFFQLETNEENKIWKKYIIFAERFMYNNEEINLHKTIETKNNEILNNLTIQALDNSGNVVKDQNTYKKEKLSNFAKICRAYIIKEDILEYELFENINGINFFPVKIDGAFNKTYKLLCFSNIINCVDYDKSIIKDFDFLSKMVLDKNKIPGNIDGFFLSGWDKYGKNRCIINEKLKNVLEKMDNEILKYKMVELNDGKM
jgi:hypothetical protein